MVKKLNNALLVLGLGFFAFLVWHTGPGALWQQVTALGWGILLLILIEGIGNLAHTVGWQYCINSHRPRVPLLRLFRMAAAGYAINYLTPTASVGGEVTRASLLSAERSGAEAVSSVLLDKLMTGVAHLLLAVVGSFFILWRVSLPPQFWVAMVVTTALLSAGMITFILLQKNGKLGALCRWLVDRNIGGRAMRDITQKVSEVDEALKKFYSERPKALLLSVGWHFFGHTAAIFEAWVFLYLLKQPTPLPTVAGAGLLSLWFDLLTFAIPLNLGTLEGSRILAFKALGCQALLGMAFGVAVRITQVFWACFGLVSYGLFGARKAPIQPKQRAEVRMDQTRRFTS